MRYGFTSLNNNNSNAIWWRVMVNTDDMKIFFIFDVAKSQMERLPLSIERMVSKSFVLATQKNTYINLWPKKINK